MPRARALLLLLSCWLALACGGRDLDAGMPEHVKRRHVVLEGAHNVHREVALGTKTGVEEPIAASWKD